MRIWIFIFMVLSGFSISALGAEQDDDKVDISLGLAAIFGTEPYKEADSEILAVPYLSLSYENFYFQGLTAGYKFSSDMPVEFGVFVAGRLDGYDDDDSEFLEGMEEREFSLDGGINMEWEENNWSVELSVAADMLNRHEGQEVSMELGYKFPISKGVFLKPSVEVEWQSDNLVNYYYGVRADEARLNRAAYQGDATFNYGLGLFGLYSLTKNVFFVGKAGYVFLGDEIADSPIIEKDYQVEGFLGAGWRF